MKMVLTRGHEVDKEKVKRRLPFLYLFLLLGF